MQDPAPHRGIAIATFLGGTRVDYVLPSQDLEVIGGGVFNPDGATDTLGASIAKSVPDHRLVWLDLRWPPR